MLVRVADPIDAESIGQVRARAWQAAYRNFLPQKYLDSLDPAQNIDELRALLAHPAPECAFRVVEVTGRIVGFSILGKPRYNTERDVIELWALNVDPSFWRRGTARALVGRAVGDARRMAKQVIELWCISANRPARALYEACGFNSVGQERTTSDLTGTPLSEVLFRRRLLPEASNELGVRI